MAEGSDHRLGRQATAEDLLILAEHLSPEDRALLDAVYERGMTATGLARAVGARPRDFRSRMRRLMRRMTSPTFRYVLRERLNWPDRRRRIAEAIFLRGESQRRAAARLGVSLHRVRKESDHIRALAEHNAPRPFNR